MEPLAVAGTLLAHLAALSLVSVGGAHAVFPDVYRLVVTEHGWMSGTEFTTLVALSQAAPGPNVLVMALIGQRVGGAALGVAALVAFCLPSSVLAWLAIRADLKAAGARWMRAVKNGLAPVTVGLVLASGLILATGSATHWSMYVIAMLSTVLASATRLHPLWLIVAGALVGALA
ncbi:MAG TPA: chromate transporter [Burkholderiales bacterium]|nr:chromate transporter [Burkholderiales bacterium]